MNQLFFQIVSSPLSWVILLLVLLIFAVIQIIAKSLIKIGDTEVGLVSKRFALRSLAEARSNCF